MGAPSARTFEHARHWVRMGHDVTVVCGLPNHPDGIVPKAYRGKWLYREDVDGIRVLRCWFFISPNRGVIRRSLSFLSFMFSATCVGLVATRPCDVVLATSPQPLCAVAGYVVSAWRRRPFVLEVRDLWPKQIVDLGVVRNPIAIRFLSAVERFLYARAEAIVTVAKATRDEIAGRGIPRAKLHTVTNGIDEELFHPMDRDTPLRERNGWGDKIVVMYIGTHGLSQGLATILDAAAMLADRPDIHFVFIGTGAERACLVEDTVRRGLKNVEFLPPREKHAMPEAYASADICLVPLKKRDVFLYNIPSKMFEIMACARPMIVGVKGQAKKLLEGAGAGIAVEPENARAFADAIRKLADDPALRTRYGRQGRDHVVAHYTRARKAADYLDCLEDLVEPPQ